MRSRHLRAGCAQLLGRHLCAIAARAFTGRRHTAAPAPASTGVRALLASKACRYAVMFGDDVQPHEGAALVEALSRTRQPLSCAHGRPTVVPLADVNRLCALLDGADVESVQGATLQRARSLLGELGVTHTGAGMQEERG